jgi:hypothetical protein
VKGLIERTTGRILALGEYVDRDVVERERDENGALMRS